MISLFCSKSYPTFLLEINHFIYCWSTFPRDVFQRYQLIYIYFVMDVTKFKSNHVPWLHFYFIKIVFLNASRVAKVRITIWDAFYWRKHKRVLKLRTYINKGPHALRMIPCCYKQTSHGGTDFPCLFVGWDSLTSTSLLSVLRRRRGEGCTHCPWLASLTSYHKGWGEC